LVKQSMKRNLKTPITPQVMAALGLSCVSLFATDWPQWRGPQRDGISAEKGLLLEWPKEGPKLLWQVEDAGRGYSTPAISGDRLFELGNEGIENEFAEARSIADGKRIWQARLGKVGNPKQEPNFPGARSTPTVDGDWVYALSSDGDLACLEKLTGKIRWQKSLRSDFGGKPGTWAYSESPLVDGEMVVCTPGGSEAALVALNKLTGEVKWKTALSAPEEAAYSSAIIVEAAGRKQYVQMLQQGLAGVDAKTGKLLWRFDKTVSRFKANIPTPLARGGEIYSAGAGTGGGLIKLSAKGETVEAEQVYFSPKLPAAIGGVVLLGNYMFGTGGSGMLCVDFGSGEVKWENRALGPGSLSLVGGLLYFQGESGEVALVEPSSEGYREKSRFSPPNRPKRIGPMEKSWTYPVVANGRLYLRDHDLLWCYDIKPAS
jgi:outer membrane protein assembly factor BamB